MWYQELFYRLAIFGPKDIVEILGISGAFYTFSIWLKQDNQKPLLQYFYGLCAIILAIYLNDLPTLRNIIGAVCPAIFLLFILIHQKSLQKNFVALQNLQPLEALPSNWLDLLLRACLISTNHKQPMHCLIEGQNALGELLITPFTIRAKLQPQLLETLLSSSKFENQKMIWLSNHGMLLGINVTWRDHINVANNKSNNLDEWQQINLLFTSETDALAFRINPQSRTFDLIAEGKLLEKLTIDQAVKFMQRYFESKTKRNYEKTTLQLYPTQEPRF